MLHSGALLEQYLAISRLLAGQLDFRSAIQVVAQEIAHIIPHDHMDVCIKMLDGNFHTAHESGMETDWSLLPPLPVSGSPIRSLLFGEVDMLLTDDACNDPRFHFEGAHSYPIVQLGLRGRLHVPLKVQGDVIGAFSCSSRTVGFYGSDDVERARAIADLLAPYFFALRAAEQSKRSAIIEAEARAREEGLRLGALRLTEALESERQRIGMDLHDQTLADLTRLARRMEKLSRSSDMAEEELEPLLRGLQHCMQDLRQIIETAQPTVLQLFGFAQAVETHLDRSLRDSGATLVWELVDEAAGAFDHLEQSVAIALFRITQEAINNAIRHAQADHLKVLLKRTSRALTVEVQDDGVGIAPSAKRSGGGIDNMRTRARLISARFDVGRGTSGVGTTVSVSLPTTRKENHS
ncbi:GAF domain-containing sensor histidine kinase [Rhizobium helianthi]|uniref:histidine kinase n=1 Tax=Rhizobium helianthi TaxID=1132695 RepID=A0ABW4M096_9HYPH